jgi:hypothetical protein
MARRQRRMIAWSAVIALCVAVLGVPLSSAQLGSLGNTTSTLSSFVGPLAEAPSDENETLPTNNTYTLPPDHALVTLLIGFGEPVCDLGQRLLASQGIHAPASKQTGHEYDGLHPACAQFRDTVQHQVWRDGRMPALEHCTPSAARLCVALGNEKCDFALLVLHGIVYMCQGGIYPYN